MCLYSYKQIEHQSLYHMKYFFIPKPKDGMWPELYFCQHDVDRSLCFIGLTLCVQFVPRSGPAR